MNSDIQSKLFKNRNSVEDPVENVEAKALEPEPEVTPVPETGAKVATESQEQPTEAQGEDAPAANPA